MEFEPLLQPARGIVEGILVDTHVNAVLQEKLKRNTLVDKELLLRIKIEKLTVETFDNTVAVYDQESTRDIFDRRLEHFRCAVFRTCPRCAPELFRL